MIFDNNDDTHTVDLTQVIPACDWGHVIITSRRKDLDMYATYTQPVDNLDFDNGSALLFGATKYNSEIHPQHGQFKVRVPVFMNIC